MTITFNMNNVAGNRINTVILRKFFQMVFVGNNRKVLNIYTATVLGGNNQGTDNRAEEDKPGTSCISELDTLKEFCMKFGFIVKGNDGNDVVSITSKNVTEQEKGFLSQVECIRQVWGNECEVICNDQLLLEEKYCHLLKKESKDLTDYEKADLASMAKSRVLWIEDDIKKAEPEMCALAIPGVFEAEDYRKPKKSELQNMESERHANDGNEKAYYRIEVPKEQAVCRGVELLNWVKTTIRFKHRLSDQNLNFSIWRSVDTRFIAPDFTWYFSPPVKSFINYESSSAEVGWKKSNESSGQCTFHETCKCPVRPEIKERLTSQRYDNVINPVANKTTVNFIQWTKDEMISYRQKYRITAKNIFTRPNDFDNIKQLNIFIDTTDEHNRGNRQYVLGIMISFALAFGIDKTRLGDAQRYFPLEKLFLADTWWLAMIISMTLNLLIRPVRVIRKRKIIYWRMINIFASFLWIFMVFCVDRSQWITDWFNRKIGLPFMHLVSNTILYNFNFYMIPQILFGAILLSNVLYVVWNILKYHDPILSGLFGEDIL